jgi:hypothetical protein
MMGCWRCREKEKREWDVRLEMRAIAIRNGKNAGGFWVCARVMLCSFRLWFEREKKHTWE